MLSTYFAFTLELSHRTLPKTVHTKQTWCSKHAESRISFYQQAKEQFTRNYSKYKLDFAKIRLKRLHKAPWSRSLIRLLMDVTNYNQVFGLVDKCQQTLTGLVLGLRFLENQKKKKLLICAYILGITVRGGGKKFSKSLFPYHIWC